MMLFSVDVEKCKRDGICVEACGRRLIEMRDKDALPTPIAGADELCNGCGHCVAACPAGALSREDMHPDECPEIQRALVIRMEQAEQFLRSRRSIRGYKDTPVAREKMERLIAAAGYAPSAHNGRPVHLLVIEDPQEVRRLAGMVVDWLRIRTREAPSSREAPNFGRVVGFWEDGRDPICRNAPHLVFAHAPASAAMADVDCIVALSYMELAAPPLGLGATWAGYVMNTLNAYPPLVEALHLPEGHRCHGALMLGYPKVKFVRMPLRKPPAVTWRPAKGSH